MCLIAHYRAKIGLFDVAKGPRNLSNLESKPMECRNTSRRSFNIRGLLSICLILLLVSAEPFSWSYNLNNASTNYNLNIDNYDRPTLCNICPYKLDWNKYMKIVNGNRASTITVGHWNGGSSQLGKSAKGQEKLEQIMYILGKNNIDVLGITEANLLQDLDPCYYRIEGYDCIKSGGNIARTVSYIKSNLNYKVCPTLMNDASAENWIEIGTHRNKWQVGVFYREFKKFGEPNTGTFEEQVHRLDSFLAKTEVTGAKGNCILIGDFNINLDPDNTENPYHNEELNTF